MRLRRDRCGDRPPALHVEDPVHGPIEQRGERLQPGGREQQPPVAGERRLKRAQRRDRGEEVAEPERAEHDEARRHGQDGSVGTAITSSRSSTSGGRLSANTTPAAISPGGASFASGGGLYCSVRPSKNAVCMPPGISSVTPTRPAVSAASARVKPTTPNFEAQYAVASPTALRPSVEATVTTRPPVRSRCGSAARTTAAVPSRFIATTRSQVSAGTSSRRPQASVPAAVTTPRSPPPASATRSTTASAARVSDRSTRSNAKPFGGGLTSSTTGVPPAASTAAATAAPRPDAPPVTITVPSSSADGTQRGLLDQSGTGLAVDERQDDGLAAPALEDGGFGQRAAGVVAALRPHVGPQALERGDRRVLLEDEHGVDAAQRAQDRGAVGLVDDRAPGALQPAHGRIRVHADDEAVAERPRRLERGDVAGMQEVEAAASGHDGPSRRADRVGDGERVAVGAERLGLASRGRAGRR